MSLDHHIKHLCKSLVCHFRSILTKNQLPQLYTLCRHVTVALFYGLPNNHLRKRQLLQNMATRFVTGARQFNHISPLLVKLNQLPISYRVVLKLVSWFFNVLNDLGPRYLVELLQYHNHSRNHSTSLLYRAIKLWNSMPRAITAADNLRTFKKNKVSQESYYLLMFLSIITLLTFRFLFNISNLLYELLIFVQILQNFFCNKIQTLNHMTTRHFLLVPLDCGTLFPQTFVYRTVFVLLKIFKDVLFK